MLIRLAGVLLLWLAACAPVPTPLVSTLPPTPTFGAPLPSITASLATASRRPLTIALTSNVSSVEFPFATETNSQNAARALYDTLLDLSSDGTFQPALADRWEISSDGKTYTFHLRNDVTFHNGELFNADSVVFTWETYRQKHVPFANYYAPADSVTRLDDYTIRVTTKEPTALMLSYIGLAWTQIPPHYYQQVGAAGFAEHPVGTGPFQMREWVKDDHLELDANPHYWRKGKPLVDSVLFKFVPESAGRVAAIKSDRIDIATRLTPVEADSLSAIPGLQILHYPVDRVYYVAFNNITGNSPAIHDPRVRLALNYAVDRAGLIRGLLEGSGQLAAGFVGPADLGWDGGAPFPYDPDRARRLLADAGYGDGLAVDMACPNRAYSHINEVCEAIVRYLDQVGVSAHLELVDSNTFWEREAKVQLPALFVDSWASYTRESYNRLEGALSAGESWSAWRDPALQMLVQEIGRTLDRGARAKLYGQLQTRMREDPPFLYLYYPETYEAVRTRVVGYRPGAGEDYVLWDIRLNEAR